MRAMAKKKEITPILFRGDEDDRRLIDRLLAGHNLKSPQDAIRVGLRAAVRDLDLLEARVKAAQREARRKP